MGVLTDLFGGDSSGDVERLMRQNRDLYDKLQLPEYAEFNPELYNTESANYELTKEDPTVRSAQLSALNRMADLSTSGESAEDAAAFNKARELGSQQARAGTEAALQNAQSRGVGGSGLEFALREQANQSGAQASQNAALEQAANAARQRALYAQAQMSGLGQVRGQDYQTNSANTNVINDFNRANTQQRNQTANANVESRNNAFMYNQGLKDKTFNNQLSKINGQTGANQGIANAYAAHDAADQSQTNALIGAGATVAGGILGRKK